MLNESTEFTISIAEPLDTIILGRKDRDPQEDYRGKFIQVYDPFGNCHIFSAEGVRQHSELFGLFRAFMQVEYGLVDDKEHPVFKEGKLRGGFLEIKHRERSVLAYGKSSTYGRFSKESLEPRIERFVSENFPDYDIHIE